MILTFFEFIAHMVEAEGFWYGVWAVLSLFGICQLISAAVSSISYHRRKKAKKKRERDKVPTFTRKAVSLRPFEEELSQKGA
jgi:hypothetical protein